MSPDLATVLATLPHGSEFRFIDRLLTLEPGRSATAEYRVRGDEPFLRGHFPGAPIFPGVLLVEAAAQLAGCLAQSDPSQAQLKNLKLASIKGAKISGTAKPGETLLITATLITRMANLIQASATISVGDKIILQTEVTLAGE
jgi:3-hydroxyacyl-[acyl-carrier-protein] dehydratase